MKQKILLQLQKLIKHELITGSFYLFIGSMLGNFFALLANVFFAHSLSAVDYGVYSALVSLITLITIPSQSINTVVAQFATKYFAKNEISHAVTFYHKTIRTIFGIIFFIVVVAGIFIMPLSSFLHISNLFLFIIAGVTIAAIYLSNLNNSYLQSMLKFKYMATLVFLGSFAKLVGGYGFNMFHVGVTGAMLAVAVSFLLPLVLGFFPIQIVFRKTAEAIQIPLREVISYGIPVALTVLSLFALTSIDVILAKHFFSAQDAGSYAALSTVGRIIFYFTGIIPTVMFPLVIKRFNKGEDYKGLFYLALLIVLIPSFGLTVCYMLIPSFILTVVVSAKYAILAPYLGVMGIYLSVFSVVNIYVSFFLSLKRTYIVYPTILAALLQIILIFLFHANFYQVIYSSIAASIFLLIVLVVFSQRMFKRLVSI